MRTCSASSAGLIWRCATELVHTEVTPTPRLLYQSSSSSLTLFLLTAIFSSWDNFFFLEMSLSDKSDEEISELLVQYGIKHGPIVDSTRKLYEKKLEQAMQEAVVKPSSDKTYYREEEEEITYITYQSPHEAYGDILKRRSNIEQEDEYEESDQESEPPIQLAERAANHSSVRSREPVRSSGGCVWKLTRLLLCGALAAALYYAYCHVINSEDSSFRIQ